MDPFTIFLLTMISAGAVYAIHKGRSGESSEPVEHKSNSTLTAAKQLCFSCGSETPGKANFCIYCGKAFAQMIDKCSVCNLDITPEDEIAKCPYCGCLSHRDHFLEWVKVRGTCPNCTARLSQLEFL